MEPASGTDVRALLATDFAWTRRQREVLDLIAGGKSNQQIADELGVSLDGAKWHMREILSKLNVETREDAAEYWRLYNGWKPRLARAFRGSAGPIALKWVAAGVVALVAVSALAVYAALNGDGDRQAGEPPESTATASATVQRSITAVATPSPTAAPAPVARSITLNTLPQAQPPETTRILGAPPDSIFPPWDGVSTVIYDIGRGVAIDLGPGSQAAYFSPDSRKAVWVSGNEFATGTEAFVLDLTNGSRQSLGAARIASWKDDGHVVVFAPGGNEQFEVDIATGARTPTSYSGYGLTLHPPQPGAPAGYLIEPETFGPTPARTYTVSDAVTGAQILTFEAVAATPAGPGELAVVAAPMNGVSNVFVIDIATGTPTFVATAIPGKDNFPFSATADAILWTDGFCGDAPGMLTLYDRSAGSLTRFDTSAFVAPGTIVRWAQLTPDGLLAVGSFGAKYLIDPATMAYRAVIPNRPDGYGGDVSWSGDYKFASRGVYGGHGGLCSG